MGNRMNLIAELAAQAEVLAPEWDGCSRSGHDVYNQQFANLILTQCIRACATDRLGKTISAEQLILTHFGVE